MKKIKNVLMILLGTFVFALAIGMFILPGKILSGGVAGITALVSNYIDLSEDIITIIINQGLFILGSIFLGREFFMNTLIFSAAYPFMLLFVTRMLPLYEIDPLLAAVYGGIIGGVGVGLMFRNGGSSGGTRPKILISDEGIDWIVKFPSYTDPMISGKREYDYSLCAKKCGIPMTRTELVKSSVCDGYFKTERFDRCDKKKVFMVTFSGILEADFRVPSCDYATYMKLIQILTHDNREDKERMYKQMCFNVLGHNRDDHTKNFSFVHTEQNGWRLSPAYDITYSSTYWGEHTTAVNGKGKDISVDDLVTVGRGAGLSKEYCISAYEEVRSAVTADLGEYL